ncbi:MAG: alginate export family protein [Myxococcota bacterium]
MRPTRRHVHFLAAALACSLGGRAVGAEEAAVRAAPAPPEPHRSLLALDLGGFGLELPLSFAERAERVSAFDIDPDGTRLSLDDALSAQVRVGARASTKLLLRPVQLAAEYEHDLITGTHRGASDDTLGPFLPNSDEDEAELRKALLRVSIGPQLHLLGGRMTSHWGMGLLANDGAHGFAPGSAQFVDPRGGDRVLRGLLAAGPFTDAQLTAAVGADRVVEDDAMIPGDEARQMVASLLGGYRDTTRVGAYAVVRRQEAADGATLDVEVFDLAGSHRMTLGDAATLALEAEAATIVGETTLAPTATFPTHKVRQLGAAARAGLDFGPAGAWLDFLYASGDRNFDDVSQNGFRVDRNYPAGMFLFRYVVAAQTSRAVVTASDPELSGRPSEDLVRFPTRGAPTNTVAVFPRGFWRILDGLELYGGPLLAWADVAPADPLNTRLAGGEPRNARGGRPGSYLGTELDGGLRYRLTLVGVELSAGIEGGVLVPGSALRDAQGSKMENVTGGRALAQCRF